MHNGSCASTWRDFHLLLTQVDLKSAALTVEQEEEEEEEAEAKLRAVAVRTSEYANNVNSSVPSEAGGKLSFRNRYKSKRGREDIN